MKTSVYIETFGCQMNVADSERAATGLRKAGYELVTSEEAADVVLFNTCSVRERAERKVFRRISEAGPAPGKGKPFVGVMGCVAQLEGGGIFDSAPDVDMVVGTRATDRIASMIERLQGGEETVIDLGERAEGESWEVSPVERHSPFVGFVPIIEGCNKFCSFCIVPYSPDERRSRSAAEIVAEVNRLGTRLQRSSLDRTEREQLPARLKKDCKVRGATPFCRLLRAVAGDRDGANQIQNFVSSRLPP